MSKQNANIQTQNYQYVTPSAEYKNQASNYGGAGYLDLQKYNEDM